MVMSLFEKMVSLEYLFECWDLFRRGKREKPDVQLFERYREDHIFALRDELVSFTYQHGPYMQFSVFDPKRRSISAASVKDRLVHQLIYSLLSPIFDKQFIFHSFSSRLEKGTHLACECLRNMIRKVGRNDSRHCFFLKLDVRKFFEHIDHDILKTLIRKVLKDEKVLVIIDIIIDSFQAEEAKKMGLPLGNLTSQLFANIYLHELDLFIKDTLKKKFYLRYCDDFIFLSPDASELEKLLPIIRSFLTDVLKVELHPQKIIQGRAHQGIDFLGYIHFSHHRILRMTTKKRMVRKLNTAVDLFFKDDLSPYSLNQTLQSYLGLLSHANHHILSQDIQNIY